jgi:hypothetical protein
MSLGVERKREVSNITDGVLESEMEFNLFPCKIFGISEFQPVIGYIIFIRVEGGGGKNLGTKIISHNYRF